MSRRLAIFVVATAAFTAAYIALNHLALQLTGGWQSLLSLVLLILYLWIAFDLVVKVIHRIVGVPAQDGRAKNLPQRLSHQQSEAVNRFWVAWLVTSVIAWMIYVTTFNWDQWRSGLVVGGLFMVVILVAYVSRRQKIMGYSKKELFK